MKELAYKLFDGAAIAAQHVLEEPEIFDIRIATKKLIFGKVE